jgi:hypothetical protein
MCCVKNISLVILAGCCGFVLCGQAQDNVVKKNPFVIRGNLGASANFYSSNELIATRPSYAWNTYGNFTATTGDVIIPFSFVLNQYSDHSPYFQGGLSPAYKWAKLHLGDRYLPFSPLVFEGQSFRGAGIELTPKHFRFMAFYGNLNRAVDQDTAINNFRAPQYSRKGYGAKIGYGNSSNFIDLSYFHATDDSSSASFVIPNGKKFNPAKDNAVFGASAKLTLFKKLIVLADVAASGLTQDLSAEDRISDSGTTNLMKVMNNFITDNNSSVAGFAGQTSLIYNSLNFNTNLSYRRVEPQFKSLGTPYLVSDQELISWTNYLSLGMGKFAVSTVLSQQHDDLDKNLPTEIKTLFGSAFINWIIDSNFSAGLGYSGYDFRNKAGTQSLKDSTTLHQLVSQFNLNPGYHFTRGYKLHYISATMNYSVLNDKNRFTSSRTNNDNLSASLNYTLGLIKKYCSFSGSAIYSNYKQDTTSYNSYGGILGASLQLLKNRNLNIQGNVGFYFNKFNSGNSQQNVTYSFSAGYLLKRHSFNAFANYIYTPPNNINAIISKNATYAVASKNLAGGITYIYVF